VVSELACLGQPPLMIGIRVRGIRPILIQPILRDQFGMARPAARFSFLPARPPVIP